MFKALRVDRESTILYTIKKNGRRKKVCRQPYYTKPYSYSRRFRTQGDISNIAKMWTR